jgi:hypothetical protein
MTAILPALVAASLLGAAPVELQLELGAQTAARSVVTGTVRTAAVEVVPRIALGASSRDGDLRFTAAYDPAILQADDGRGVWQVLHRGLLRAEVQASETWRLTTSVSGSYGTSDPLFTLRAQPGTFSLIPTNLPLQTASGEVALALDGRHGERTSTRSVLVAFGSGGADATARADFPAMLGVRGETGVGWKASRRDLLSARLSGTAMTITPDGRAAFGIATGTWRRDLARNVAAWAGAGGGASWSLPRGGVARTAPAFSAELGVSHSPRARVAAERPPLEPRPPYAAEGSAATPRNEPRPLREDETVEPPPEAGEPLPEVLIPAERAIDRLSEELVARVTPSVDRSSGAVGEQAEATLLGQWRASESWTLSAGATGGVLLLESAGTPLIGHVELKAAWAFARSASIAWGLAGSWQRPTSDAAGAPPFLGEYGAFLAVSWGIGKR